MMMMMMTIPIPITTTIMIKNNMKLLNYQNIEL